MALVPQYDPTLDRQNMAIQASLLQNLGAQIRKDVQTVQTNRQLKGFTEGLQNVNPDSDQFGQQIVGLMGQYPMALQTPLAQSAVSQLGAQHRYWQQEQVRQQDPWRYAGQGTMYNQATGETKTAFEPTVKPTVIRTPRGALLVDPETNEEVARFGDPFAPPPPRAGTATPEVRSVGSALTKALNEFSRKDAEATGLESRWNQMEKDGTEKWTLGKEATTAREQANVYKRRVEELSKQLKELSTVPITPASAPLTPDSAFVQPGAPSIPVSGGVVEPPLPEAQSNGLMPETIPTNPKPSAMKPIPQEILQQANQAIQQGRSKAGVIKKLQDAGFDVSGL